MANKDIFVITTENTSQQYTDLKSHLSDVGTLKDIFYANKKFKGSTMSKKLEAGMKQCPVILVCCSPDFKIYIDERSGESKCALLKKDEKSALEKGFKANEKKIVLVQYSEGDENKLKPNLKSFKELKLSPAFSEDDIETLKMKILEKQTSNQK